MKLMGFPIFGFWLPFIGWRNLPVNRSGSIISASGDILEARSPFFITAFALEWLGLGVSFLRAPVPIRDAISGEIVGEASEIRREGDQS